MDTLASFGGLIPLWILVAPVVLVAISSLGGNNASSRHTTDTRAGYAPPMATRDAALR